MSMTLKCDKCNDAFGDEMHGFEAVYGFGGPEIKMGGHFCPKCFTEHLKPLLDKLRFVVKTERVTPGQGQGMPNQPPPSPPRVVG